MTAMLSRLRLEDGFTLTEVLAATVLLLVGLVGVITLLDFANLETARSRDREASNNLAREITETAKKVPFSAATPTGIASALKAQPGLADANPLTTDWEIKARGVTFKVAVSVCSVDDSKDGYGSHSAGNFCGTEAGMADTSPEDYRRMTVSLEPLDGSTWDKKTAMSSFIADTRSGESGTSDPTGLGEGFAILMDPLCGGCSSAAWSSHAQVAPCKTFTATVGADKCLPTYNGAAGPNYAGNQISSIPVKAIFPTGVASAKFYVVRWGVWWNSFTWPQVWPSDSPEFLGFGSQAGDPRAWTYSWGLQNTYPNQTPDGLYDIRAVGYDAQGAQVGQPLVLSFWLNRFIPDLGFYGLRAGRNQLNCTSSCPTLPAAGATPEIEWFPRTGVARRDYDIKDFKILRSGTTTPVICTMAEFTWRGAWERSFTHGHHTNGTRCKDTRTPAPPTSGTLTYTLRSTSWSPDGMAEVEGANVQTSANANQANPRPTAPSGVTVDWQTIGGSKYLRVRFTNPSGRGDTGPGNDCVTSFRIHRTGNTAALPAGGAPFARTPAGVYNSTTAPCATSGATTTTWVNPVFGGWTSGQQRYYVTSVDTFNNESTGAVSSGLLPAP